MNRPLFFLICLVVLSGCRTGRINFSPDKTYDPVVLKKDLNILTGALEAHHPGLYWYQSKEDWKKQVNLAITALNQPLSEPEFRKILRPLVASIRCGHTSIRASKQWQRYSDTLPIKKLFPISVKCWADTMLVLGSLEPKDSILIRGAQILSINGDPPRTLYEKLFPYVFGDGFNETHKYQLLSGWGSFGNYYRQFVDTTSTLRMEVLDSLGNRHSITRTLYTPVKDTTKRAPAPLLTKKQKRARRLEGVRSLLIDRSDKQALLRINSFGQGSKLRKFFRQGFNLLKKTGVSDLIIDVRNNGGGRVGNSTALTRYLVNRPFKIADSLYAVRRASCYGRYIQNNLGIQLSLPFLTRENKNFYHFGYFERHALTPKRKKHFSGSVYVLTGGNSFSATTLFVNSIKEQENVTVIGEETGGGAYGNSAWMIPDLTLPHTGVRMRLPLFRMVMNKNLPNNGRGIEPEVEIGPTVESVRRNYDNKMLKASHLILKNRRKGS